MKVKQLIEELEKQDADADVYTWDAYQDAETNEIHVCKMLNETVMVSNWNF